MTNEEATQVALTDHTNHPHIWRPPSVDREPSVTLTRWTVIRCEFEDGTTSDHAVGYCGTGRVTSAIKERRPDTGEIVTRSGRVYKLSGSPGVNMDAMYVWDYWARANRVQKETDVRKEYYEEILSAETGLD